HYGQRVDRPAALASLLFTTAKVPLFNVKGGRVRVSALFGEVTVQLGADATLVKLTGTPIVGSAVDLCANSASVANLAAGQRLMITGTLANAMAIANAGGSLWEMAPQVIGVGTIDVTGSVQGTAGQIRWTLCYLPLDDGAYVERTL